MSLKKFHKENQCFCFFFQFGRMDVKIVFGLIFSFPVCSGIILFCIQNPEKNYLLFCDLTDQT